MSLPFGCASLDQDMRSSAALFFLFTSTRLFIQEFVARGAVTLITNSLVLADVGAATVVVCTLIQACRDSGNRGKGRDGREETVKNKTKS